MPEYRTVPYPVSSTGMKKNADPGTMQLGTGIRESSPVPECSGTGLRSSDAGMPMQDASASMPIPNYANMYTILIREERDMYKSHVYIQ